MGANAIKNQIGCMSDSEKQLLQETHDAVIRLETRFNGGPGHWPSCMLHSDDIGMLKRTVALMQKQLWLAIGGGAVVLFILEKVWK